MFVCVCVCRNACVLWQYPVGQDFAFLAHDLCSTAKQCEANAQRFLKWVKHVACGTKWMRNIPIPFPPHTHTHPHLPRPFALLPCRPTRRTRKASAAFHRICSCWSQLDLASAGDEFGSGSRVGVGVGVELPGHLCTHCRTLFVVVVVGILR